DTWSNEYAEKKPEKKPEKKKDKDTLGNDETLKENEYLKSKNGKYYARMQDYGNFVLYKSDDFSASNAFWASQTGGIGNGPFRLIMQNDGNLVVYDKNYKPTWDSNSWNAGAAQYRLVMQDDRNLVIYDKK